MSAKDILLSASGIDRLYVEDVFSTYIYSGTGANTSISNGIDLSKNGGLVWIKSRNNSAFKHALYDTARGVNKPLCTNNTNGQSTPTDALTSFNSNGFSLGVDSSSLDVNASGGYNYTSWSFRKAQKFFDVVTYTGNGSARTISHNLGSVPGCIIVKCTSTTSNWAVYHKNQTSASYYTKLNLTDTQTSDTTVWNATAPTSSVFSVGTSSLTNTNGATYVAYIFADNAGGFGDFGADNVISCGSFTTDGSGNASVTLGYEPQWVLIKESTATSSYGWILLDNIRGWDFSGSDSPLYANAVTAESAFGGGNPTSTGFVSPTLVASSTYIYIAIRRPMKTPTSGTSVFSPITASDSGGTVVTTGFTPDSCWYTYFRSSGTSRYISSRLQGNDVYLNPGSTPGETSYPTSLTWNTKQLGFESTYAQSAYNPIIFWNFKRAAGFFDVVCYTGTGANTTISHNLNAVPSLMIVKRRNTNGSWWVYDSDVGNTKYSILNSTTIPATYSAAWNNTSPTNSVFTLGTDATVNASGGTYIAYLFASLSGISKIGTYNGNGTNQTINCGFAAGARFVMIKCTSTTGDWFIWDTARGIVAANDPSLSLNTAAAEVTTDDSIDPDSTGFIVNQVAATNINSSSNTYIYLAIS